MLVGILADSHDNMPKIRVALELFRSRGIRTVIHAGDVVAPFSAKVLASFDGEVFAVFGNNDGEHPGLAKVLDIVDPPRTLTLDGRTVVVAHDLSQVPPDAMQAADLVVTGHTHEPGITGEDPVLLNPGEAGGWLNGRSTCAVFDLQTLEGELCDI